MSLQQLISLDYTIENVSYPVDGNSDTVIKFHGYTATVKADNTVTLVRGDKTLYTSAKPEDAQYTDFLEFLVAL